MKRSKGGRPASEIIILPKFQNGQSALKSRRLTQALRANITKTAQNKREKGITDSSLTAVMLK